ncbi:hypothetical protein EVAR_58546_1 [Eumeta japonica]|uniref:Uncharacterized protein n=1 Tax=Eumeta variegata TaxID=151549 RepID=A0A4C1Z2D0_EUMVA|nr:hypothetical protein EVAR_58546_1 [Eumeta japonica]
MGIYGCMVCEVCGDTSSVPAPHTRACTLAPLRKPCSWRLPHNLTEAQKLRRVHWCREMIQKFAGDESNAVYDMVTASAEIVGNPLRKTRPSTPAAAAQGRGRGSRCALHDPPPPRGVPALK